jgi:hypothetical protein
MTGENCLDAWTPTFFLFFVLAAAGLTEMRL